MKDLLIECRTALGLAKSMAERERYDTDVYTKRIEMIDKALRKPAVSDCTRCKTLEMMIDNGLGWEDMKNDITYPRT